MAVYGYTKNYKLVKPEYDSDTWHDYEYDNLDTIDAILSAIYQSGQFRGFWANNTSYKVKDVVIDKDTDTMYTVIADHTTPSDVTFAAYREANPSYYRLWNANELAKDWAIKTDGKIVDYDVEDYSAKAYAIGGTGLEQSNAKYYAETAGASEGVATEKANAASVSAAQALVSETNAKTSEVNAKQSETNAKASEIVAKAAQDDPNVVAVGTDLRATDSAIKKVSANMNDVSAVVMIDNEVVNVSSAINQVVTVAGIKNQVVTTAEHATAIQQISDNINAVLNAPQDAEKSRIYAYGTDAEVQTLGGVHSAKGWAEQSTSVNFSLTNTPYTTNRILEIPQDIKLELNNGTLTLKAGSKVWVPDGLNEDGSKKFNCAVVSNDISRTVSPDNSLMFFYDNGTLEYGASTFQCFSGETVPTTTQTNITWYDTATNYIKSSSNGGQSWSAGRSLPICIISNTTTIDQVFNGFGYIGSTVFALPGVKVQIPYGRNADGTCKSLITNITSVKTLTVNASWGTYDILITHSGGIEKWPDIASGSAGTRYNAATNYYEVISNGKWIPQLGCVFVKIKTDTTSPYKIKSFEPYTVDSILNSSLSNLSAAGQAKFDAKANIDLDNLSSSGQAKFDAKANVSNTVTTDTAQTIGGSKRFTQSPEGMSIELTADTNQQTVPAITTLRQLGLYRNTTHTKGDGYTSWIQGYRGSDGLTSTEMYARRFLESDSQEIINYIRVNVTSAGIPLSSTRTPPTYAAGEEITTAEWFSHKMQVVSTLPANPDPNVFYFIPE